MILANILIVIGDGDWSMLIQFQYLTF